MAGGSSLYHKHMSWCRSSKGLQEPSAGAATAAQQPQHPAAVLEAAQASVMAPAAQVAPPAVALEQSSASELAMYPPVALPPALSPAQPGASGTWPARSTRLSRPCFVPVSSCTTNARFCLHLKLWLTSTQTSESVSTYCHMNAHDDAGPPSSSGQASAGPAPWIRRAGSLMWERGKGVVKKASPHIAAVRVGGPTLEPSEVACKVHLGRAHRGSCQAW